MIRGELPSYGWDERIWCANLKPPRLHGSYVFFVVDQGQIGWKLWVPQFKAGVVAKADHSFGLT